MVHRNQDLHLKAALKPGYDPNLTSIFKHIFAEKESDTRRTPKLQETAQMAVVRYG